MASACDANSFQVRRRPRTINELGCYTWRFLTNLLMKAKKKTPCFLMKNGIVENIYAKSRMGLRRVSLSRKSSELK